MNGPSRLPQKPQQSAAIRLVRCSPAPHRLEVCAAPGELILDKGCPNGPTEAMNLPIKKVKRVGHGFRNFTNYRLRLLLHCGVT